MEHKNRSIEKVLSLQSLLEEALENYWHFLDIGDYRLADMWNEMVEQISKDIRRL